MNLTMSDRSEHLERFYATLGELELRLGGARMLGQCNGTMYWPERGVYFFREPGEFRSDGRSHRIVRVGTHAIKYSQKSTLWQRLRQHRGNLRGAGAGNHRSSRFRLWLGTAILARDGNLCPSWMVGNAAPEAALLFGVTAEEIQEWERLLEIQVSKVIGAMSVLWLSIDDAPGPHSLRAYIKRNSAALLSNYGKEPPLDRWSDDWLGKHCASPYVSKSGQWSVNHVTEHYDPAFLERLESLVHGLPGRH